MQLRNIPSRGLGNHREPTQRDINADVRAMQSASGDQPPATASVEHVADERTALRPGAPRPADAHRDQMGDMIEDVAKNRSYSMAANTTVDDNKEFSNWLTGREKENSPIRYADIGGSPRAAVDVPMLSDNAARPTMKDRFAAAMFKGPIDAMQPGITLGQKTDFILEAVGKTAPGLRGVADTLKAGKQIVESPGNNATTQLNLTTATQRLLQNAQLGRLLATNGSGAQAQSILQARLQARSQRSEPTPS